jgi:hypothetical protein
MKKIDSRAFWVGSESKTKINDYLLRGFLTEEGFAQFQSTTKRISRKQIFHNNDGILELHNANSIKTWLRIYFESTADGDFKSGKMFGGKDGGNSDKYTVLSILQSYSISKVESVLTQLDVYSQGGYKDTIPLNLFNDKHGVAHIRFNNGIVKVTKNEIKLLTYSSVKNQGAVWETSIIQRDIKIDGSKGLYEQFCEGALSFKNPDKKSDVWMKNYDLDEDQYLAMRTGFGYLLHTYNAPEVPKCVYFIDSDSELGKPQGGNGKSLIMKSIKHFKETIMIDGKVFRKSMDSGGQFQFSMVTPDTTLLVIDDIRPEFDFDMLFSKITSDMQIEMKGKDILIIPEKDKPKFGVTTNYVIAGVGSSYKRRQHIVEFGNYWSNCNDLEEKPSDNKHLGKTLFTGSFSEKDWNQFYTFGFKCLQEYFQKGLIESPNQTHMDKTLRLEIEGAEGDGSITDWMEGWCQKERLENNYNTDGIAEKELYEKFISENEDLDSSIWDVKMFRESFWKFIDLKPEYDYNPQFSKNGKTQTQRRWMKGSAGSQERWYMITDVRIKRVVKTTTGNTKEKDPYGLNAIKGRRSRKKK